MALFPNLKSMLKSGWMTALMAAFCFTAVFTAYSAVTAGLYSGMAARIAFAVLYAYAAAQLVPNPAVVCIEVGISCLLVIARIKAEAGIIDIASAILGTKPHGLVAQEDTTPPVVI